jgi:hypothetical protein
MRAASVKSTRRRMRMSDLISLSEGLNIFALYNCPESKSENEEEGLALGSSYNHSWLGEEPGAGYGALNISRAIH